MLELVLLAKPTCGFSEPSMRRFRNGACRAKPPPRDRDGSTNDNQVRQAKLPSRSVPQTWIGIEHLAHIYMYNDGAAPTEAGGTPAVPTLHAFFNASRVPLASSSKLVALGNVRLYTQT